MANGEGMVDSVFRNAVIRSLLRKQVIEAESDIVDLKTIDDGFLNHLFSLKIKGNRFVAKCAGSKVNDTESYDYRRTDFGRKRWP